MGIVLGLMTVLGAVVFTAWSALRGTADGQRPQHDLEAVALVQKQTLLSRGSFVSSPTAMSVIEPAFRYVSGDQPATSLDGNNYISVAVTPPSSARAQDAVLYVSALSDAGVCYGMAVADPRSDTAVVQLKRMPGQFGSCTAQSFTQGGGQPW